MTVFQSMKSWWILWSLSLSLSDMLNIYIYSGLDNTGPAGEPGAKGEKGQGGDPNNQPGVPGTAGLKGFQGPIGESLFLCINDTHAQLLMKCVENILHVFNGVLYFVFYFVKRFNPLCVSFVQVIMVILGYQDSGAQSDQTAQRTDQEEEGILAILDLKGTKVGGLKKIPIFF